MRAILSVENEKCAEERHMDAHDSQQKLITAGGIAK
jgi:hypothetical protein